MAIPARKGSVPLRRWRCWMATTAALARQVGAKMILGLNLVANQPQLAAAEARDYVAAFHRNAIEALEIGNEPNIYSQLTVDHTLLESRKRPRLPEAGR